MLPEKAWPRGRKSTDRQGGVRGRLAENSQKGGREEEAEGKDKQKPFLPAASVRQRASAGSDVSADSSKSTLRSPRPCIGPT